MSPPEVWGPAVWTLFHTLAEKVNDQAYPFIKVQLFAQIRRICGFLPCPECSADATNFLAKVNIDNLKTKIDFRNTFYLFHNMVNAKKRKPLFNYSNVASYNNYGIVPVINNFISKYNTKGNMKLLAESFQRKIVLSDFKSWFTKTIRAFTPPQNVPLPISEIKIEESVSVTEEVETSLCCGREVANEEVVTNEESTITTEDAAILTEEVVSEATVEEVVVTEEVVSEETDIVEEVVVTEEPAITEEIVTTEEVASEVTATVEEVIVTEEIVTEEEVITEESAVTEEIVTTEEEVTSEATVEEVVESEATVTEEEEVVQPKPKKVKKSKK